MLRNRYGQSAEPVPMSINFDFFGHA